MVSVSSGKDSEATQCYCLETEPIESILFVFADTGNEHPLVYEHLDYLEGALGLPIVRLRANFTLQIANKRTYVLEKWPGKGVASEIVARAAKILEKPTGNPYLDLCLWKGRFPSRKAQFCTQFLKTIPLVEYQMEIIDQGNTVWSWQGVRGGESDSRKHLLGTGACAKYFEEVGGGLYIYRPIVRWQAQDCFDAMELFNVKPNPLYSMGMSRVGCMPCINANKAEVLEIAQRFPEEFERIAEWESLVGQAGKGARGDISSFFPDPDRDAHLNKRGIVNMVEWSKTSRGGKQFNIFAEAVGSGCSSSYGLCDR